MVQLESKVHLSKFEKEKQECHRSEHRKDKLRYLIYLSMKTLHSFPHRTFLAALGKPSVSPWVSFSFLQDYIMWKSLEHGF